MLESRFYWESRGEEYPFNPTKSYLVYFKGCFAPPHAGHFNTIKQLIDKGDNIYGMIHQIGSKSRHGVPYRLNRKIWKKYIEELLPSDRLFLVKYGSRDDILNLDVIEEIDTIVYIRGNENYDERSTEINILNRFKSFINRLNRRGISLDFYYMDRPLLHKLSATKFVQKLVRTKKKCRKEGCNCKYDKIKYFLPEGLSKETAMYLIKRLQKQYLVY